MLTGLLNICFRCCHGDGVVVWCDIVWYGIVQWLQLAHTGVSYQDMCLYSNDTNNTDDDINTSNNDDVDDDGSNTDIINNPRWMRERISVRMWVCVCICLRVSMLQRKWNSRFLLTCTTCSLHRTHLDECHCVMSPSKCALSTTVCCRLMAIPPSAPWTSVLGGPDRCKAVSCLSGQLIGWLVSDEPRWRMCMSSSLLSCHVASCTTSAIVTMMCSILCLMSPLLLQWCVIFSAWCHLFCYNDV